MRTQTLGIAGAAGPRGSLRRTVERNDRPGLVSLDKEILSELEPYLDCSLPFSGNFAETSTTASCDEPSSRNTR